MNELLTVSGTELARRIRARELTSRAIVDAHIAHAERVNPTLNAIVAERYAQARDEADEADAAVSRGDDLSARPFHGVPCTIKEAFALTGMPNSSGLVARRDVIADRDATAVARLRAAGAIPLGVTNTSELCMWMESVNRVYGITSNPYDASRTVGGSSGGEGAIVGSGASPFGLGSDIGGSIRMPAFFNGVFGHKPTGGLVPGTGQYPMAEGDATRYLTTGPICRRADDLMPLLRTMAGPDGSDPGCVDIDLGDPETVSLRGMTVAVVHTNGFRRPNRDIADAIRRSARALEEAGARVRPVEMPKLRRSLQVWSSALTRAGGAPYRELLGNGGDVHLGRELWRWMRRRSDYTLPSLALAAIESIEAVTAAESASVLTLTEELRAELDQVVGDAGVMLYPPYTRPAPRHHRAVLTPLDWVYTAVLNVMQHPVTQVPTGLTSGGLPTGVQVIGPHRADHVPIAVATYLERTLGGWVPPR